MFNISEKTLDKLRTQYPKGTLGTVMGVDDAGSIMVSWDTGSSLSVVYGEDIVEKL